MRSKLTPLATNTAMPASSGEFALIELSHAEQLASVMPDARSAVLFLLGWQAARQVRLSFGPCAGRRVARISASTLAQLAGRPVRTIRWAIAELLAAGLIEQERTPPGWTNIYLLTLP